MINIEQILEDAEVAALFLRTLTDKGVPVKSAVDMTTSYLSSRLFSRLIPPQDQPPREPWKDT